MAKMDLPPWLTKKYGPLPGWGWILAGILGILLGLYLRRVMAARSAAGGDTMEAGPWSDLGGAATREGIGIVGDTTPEPPASDIATPEPKVGPFPEVIRIDVPKIIPMPSPTEDAGSAWDKLRVMPNHDHVEDNKGVRFIVKWGPENPVRYRISGGTRQSQATKAFGKPLRTMQQVPSWYAAKIDRWSKKNGWGALDLSHRIILDVRAHPFSEEQWSGQGIVGGIPA